MSRSEHSQHLAIRVLILGMNQFSKPQGLCRLTANLALCLADSDEISEVSVAVGTWQIAHLQDCFGLHGSKIMLIPADCGNNVQSRYTYYYFGFPALAKMIRPDIVHFAFPKPFFRKSIAAPVVTTVLDLYAWDAPSTIGYPDIYLSRFVLRNCGPKQRRPGLHYEVYPVAPECSLLQIAGEQPSGSHLSPRSAVADSASRANCTSAISPCGGRAVEAQES